MNEQPYETVLNIVKYLETEDIKNWCMTNTEYNKICNDNIYWKNRTLEDFGLPEEYYNNIPGTALTKYLTVKHIIDHPQKSLTEGIRKNDPVKTQIALMYNKNIPSSIWDEIMKNNSFNNIDILRADKRVKLPGKSTLLRAAKKNKPIIFERFVNILGSSINEIVNLLIMDLRKINNGNKYIKILLQNPHSNKIYEGEIEEIVMENYDFTSALLSNPNINRKYAFLNAIRVNNKNIIDELLNEGYDSSINYFYLLYYVIKFRRYDLFEKFASFIENNNIKPEYIDPYLQYIIRENPEFMNITMKYPNLAADIGIGRQSFFFR